MDSIKIISIKIPEVVRRIIHIQSKTFNKEMGKNKQKSWAEEW